MQQLLLHQVHIVVMELKIIANNVIIIIFQMIVQLVKPVQYHVPAKPGQHQLHFAVTELKTVLSNVILTVLLLPVLQVQFVQYHVPVKISLHQYQLLHQLVHLQQHHF